MTHQHHPIREKLQAIIERYGVTFFFDTWNRANKSLETAARDNGGTIYPAALMISTSAGAFQLMTTGTHRQEDIALAFFDRTERDDTERDYEVQQRMIELSATILQDINDGNYSGLEIVGDAVRYSPFTDRLDENVAGVVLTLTLRDLTPEECK